MAIFRTRMLSDSAASVFVKMNVLTQPGKQKLKLQSIRVRLDTVTQVDAVEATMLPSIYWVTVQDRLSAFALLPNEVGFKLRKVINPKVVERLTATRIISVFQEETFDNFKDIVMMENPYIVLESTVQTNNYIYVEVEYSVSTLSELEAAQLSFG